MTCAHLILPVAALQLASPYQCHTHLTCLSRSWWQAHRSDPCARMSVSTLAAQTCPYMHAGSFIIGSGILLIWLVLNVVYGNSSQTSITAFFKRILASYNQPGHQRSSHGHDHDGYHASHHGHGCVAGCSACQHESQPSSALLHTAHCCTSASTPFATPHRGCNHECNHAALSQAASHTPASSAAIHGAAVGPAHCSATASSPAAPNPNQQGSCTASIAPVMGATAVPLPWSTSLWPMLQEGLCEAVPMAPIRCIAVGLLGGRWALWLVLDLAWCLALPGALYQASRSSGRVYRPPGPPTVLSKDEHRAAGSGAIHGGGMSPMLIWGVLLPCGIGALPLLLPQVDVLQLLFWSLPAILMGVSTLATRKAAKRPKSKHGH
jgi:hypothetical protein